MGRFSEWQARAQPSTAGAPEPDSGAEVSVAQGGALAAKADSREPERSQKALPMGLRVGMRVRIVQDVFWADKNGLCVARGTPGDVVGPCDEEHVMVRGDRVYRDGYRATYPVRLRADVLERHPHEKMQLDPRTAPASGQDVDGALPEESAEQRWQDWEMPQRPQVKPQELGSGALYEVVAEKAALRVEPSLAAPALGCKMKGRCVELFDWDETQLWRRCVDGVTWLSGWMLLDSIEFGPLLRPKGLPFQVKPHEPLCIAAHENNAEDIKAFLQDGHDPNVRDAGHRTPLSAAAAAGHLDACVLLFTRGANAREALAQLRVAADEREAEAEASSSDERLAIALLAAFAGCAGGDDFQDVREARDRLSQEMREAADQVLRESRDDQLRHLAWSQWRSEQAATRSHVGGLASQGEPPLASSEGAEAAAEPQADEVAAAPTAKYEVIVKSCAIRAEPTVMARAIGARAAGMVVELGEYDESGSWRKLPARYLGNRGDGWMLLCHETLGQLLRPFEA